VVFASLGIILSIVFTIVHIKLRNQIDYYTRYSLNGYPYFFKYQPTNVTVNINLDPQTMTSAFNLAIALNLSILMQASWLFFYFYPLLRQMISKVDLIKKQLQNHHSIDQLQQDVAVGSLIGPNHEELMKLQKIMKICVGLNILMMVVLEYLIGWSL
jgi:hypothetical protein